MTILGKLLGIDSSVRDISSEYWPTKLEPVTWVRREQPEPVTAEQPKAETAPPTPTPEPVPSPQIIVPAPQVTINMPSAPLPAEAERGESILASGEKIKWHGTKRDFAEWVVAAHEHECIRADSQTALLTEACKHFVDKDGEAFAPVSLRQNLLNKKNEGKPAKFSASNVFHEE